MFRLFRDDKTERGGGEERRGLEIVRVVANIMLDDRKDGDRQPKPTLAATCSISPAIDEHTCTKDISQASKVSNKGTAAPIFLKHINRLANSEAISGHNYKNKTQQTMIEPEDQRSLRSFYSPRAIVAPPQ